MKKTILLSMKPENVLNVIQGNKTFELRKSIPKNYKGWVYIYCNVSNVLEKSFLGFRVISINQYYRNGIGTILSGLVVARFWFDEYTIYEYQDMSYPEGYEDYDGNWVDTTEYVEGYPIFAKEQTELCLSYYTIEKYGNKKPLYAWHIKELEIFEKPLELNNFYKNNIDADEFKNSNGFIDYRITKAPNNYQFVYIKKEMIQNDLCINWSYCIISYDISGDGYCIMAR